MAKKKNKRSSSNEIESKKTRKRDEVGGGIITTTTTMDHISKLPDDLLHCILSLLDIKQVVQTSVLSSRWKYLWISMPIVDINQTVFQYHNALTSDSHGRFVNFVDMVLQTKTSSIQKLRLDLLYCESDYDGGYDYGDDLIKNKQLYRWIVDAVRLNVSVLDLQIDYYQYTGKEDDRLLDLPFCLFNCNTLTSLTLCFTESIYILDLSYSVCLTALKTLHLRSLFLTGEKDTDSFFSRCPVLETLIIFNCIFEYDYNNNYLPSSIFKCETLVTLKLDVWCGEDVPIFNDMPDSINLPSLKSLDVEGSPLFGGESNINLFFSNCPSLESLNLCFSNDLHVHNDVFFRYVFTCKTLVKLYVRDYVCIPDFVDLPCLKTLSLKSLCFVGGGITDNFFLGCPVLETLIIFKCTITNSFFFWSKSRVNQTCAENAWCKWLLY